MENFTLRPTPRVASLLRNACLCQGSPQGCTSEPQRLLTPGSSVSTRTGLAWGRISQNLILLAQKQGPEGFGDLRRPSGHV